MKSIYEQITLTGPELQALVVKASEFGFRKAMQEIEAMSGTERILEHLEKVAEYRSDEVNWKQL